MKTNFSALDRVMRVIAGALLLLLGRSGIVAGG